MPLWRGYFVFTIALTMFRLQHRSQAESLEMMTSSAEDAAIPIEEKGFLAGHLEE